MPERSILIVDDDPGIVQLVVAILKRDGYRTLTAFDGPTALQSYEANAPDLILLDLAMPGMSGFEVIEAIREREGDSKHTLIVLLTAHAQSYFISTVNNVDIDGYIIKPVAADKLRQEIRTAFGD
jgi:two-component system alkaline phosphatase synthesis response regulator PhoP